MLIKNTQHLAKITPRILILNPLRTHNTFDKKQSLQKPFLKFTYTKLQYSRMKIEYTSALQIVQMNRKSSSYITHKQ